ncbi:hypothetical protein Ahy_A02g010091 [Arachis hypogaea]|uniref:Uncharacterized protein n=1 Tax=Arachis hypogaea TaxID=3818 RepID=A0A445EJB7_ARAHY|nr:hypothetical protein Ahy_A02g010091 [Arachis hypogaea]
MFVRCTIENNDEAGIRPIKTYQSFVATIGGHRELSFIEKDVRNYITRKDIQSFKWLFECWLRCMGENAPKAFLLVNVHRCKWLLRLSFFKIVIYEFQFILITPFGFG